MGGFTLLSVYAIFFVLLVVFYVQDENMALPFEYVFPAIRGIQAGREYYVSMCPVRLIPKIFSFDDEEIPPEMRAQRILNRSRVPEIARYVVSNPTGYVFSAITVSINADIAFESIGSEDIGRLTVPMDARFVINDGQHRRAAFEQALKENPDLGDETIAVVFFLDIGLKRSQQMFTDLNRYAVHPDPSLNILYDNRDRLKDSPFRSLDEIYRRQVAQAMPEQ
jgi:DNA sulfur modification protein DndB